MKNFSNKELKQPVISMHPEPNHQPEDVLTITSFLDLLKDEEDYFDGDQHHTKLMITRLRKIFYDKWGWNRRRYNLLPAVNMPVLLSYCISFLCMRLHRAAAFTT